MEAREQARGITTMTETERQRREQEAEALARSLDTHGEIYDPEHYRLFEEQVYGERKEKTI